MADVILFEDIFTITDTDPGGRKFDKVSRVVGRSEKLDMDLMLDVNVEVYPLRKGDRFALVLAHTLALDGTPDEGSFDPTERKSLMDKFEYVMYGKLYKTLDSSAKGVRKLEMYVSFGGLLMMLKGDSSHLNDLHLDQRLYLLMRKVS